MLDYPLRQLTNPALDSIAPFFVRLRISANMITAFASIPALIAFICIIKGYFLWAALAILLNRFCDGLDGRVAQKTQPTDFGAYFDIVSDFLFYGSVPLAFALLAPADNAIGAVILLFAFMGSGSSFLMFAVLGYRRKLPNKWGLQKGFYYAGGLVEGSETIIAFLLFCLFPEAFALLAVIFAVLCLITTMFRIASAYALSAKP